MANIRVKDLDTKASFASDDEILMDSPSGTGTMLRDAFISAVAAQIVAAPSTYKIATLDGADKLTSSQDPSQSVSYLGGHDVVANSPALADGTGTAGDTYYVTNPGTRDYGSGNITAAEGDALVYSGSVWQLVEGIANILDGISTASTARTTLEVNSVDEDAEATGTKLVGPALYFDGSNDYVEVADDDKFSFTDGTDDLSFSVSAWVKVEDAGNCVIVSKYGTSASTREWQFQIDGSGTGKLAFWVVDSSGNIVTVKHDAAWAYTGKWAHVACSYAGSGPNSDNAFTAAGNGVKLYINGTDITSESTVANNASYGGMSNTAQAVWLGRATSLYGNLHIRDARIFNRALTAAEVASLARSGTLPDEFADEFGGAVGGVYTSNFTGDSVDGFTNLVAASSDATQTVGGDADNIQVTVDNTTAVHYIRRQNNVFTVGKRYRLSADIYVPSTNSDVDGVAFGSGTGINTNVIVSSASPSTDTWVTVSGEVLVSDNTNSVDLCVFPLEAGSLTVSDAGGDDTFAFRNIKITQIGTLADFRAERFDASTDKLYDLSSNNYIGTNNGATLVGREVPVYETGTWTPSLYFAGTSAATYSVQDGYYSRVGDTVYIRGSITLSGIGASSGAVSVAGLPFQPSGDGASSSVMPVHMTAALNLTSSPTGLVEDGVSQILLYDAGATGQTALDETNFGASTVLKIAGTYKIQ